MLRTKAILTAAAVAIAACSQASPAPSSPALTASAADPAPTATPAPAAAPTVFGAPELGFPVHSVLAPDGLLHPGDYVWEAEGVPPGPLTIVVDLEARMLHAYRGGVEIGRVWIIYGDDDKPTPTGVFPILEKDVDHVSNLYDAEMPYMLRLTWDGIAIHGSPIGENAATHGCIGVPEEFAELLFAEARVGDSVMVTNGWMRPAAPQAAPTA